MKCTFVAGPRRVALVLLLASALVAACDKPSGEGSTPSAAPAGSPAPRPKIRVPVARASASSAASAPMGSASPTVGASGDPFSGAQAEPGDEVPIPYAKGYVVVAPKGWKAEGHEKGGDTVLTPPSGRGTIVFAGTASGSALELRVSDFLKATTTGGATWGPEAKATLGVDSLAATVFRGEGFRTLAKGQKEIHKVLRVLVKTDIKDLELDVNGRATVTIQALAEWNADEADFEKSAIEAIKGIKKKK